jgi:hypothetical protein
MSSTNHFVGCGAVARLAAVTAAVFVIVGCSRELPARSTTALMDDPAVLQAVLFRCNQLQGTALRDAECRNAREAVDRLAADDGSNEEARKEAQEAAQFEKARAARRLRDEHERRRKEAEMPTEPDPYTLPLVPAQPEAPMQADAPSLADAPLQTIVVSAASLPADR